MLEKQLKAVYRPRGRAREYSEWALNLSLGCTHGCKYCYAPRVVRKSKEEFHAAAPVRKGIFEKLEHDLVLMRDAGVRDRVLLCFTTDPYCTPEMARATRRALEMFLKYDVPFQVLTKGGFFNRELGHIPQRDFELYRRCDAFGVTLTFEGTMDSLSVEPNAAVGLSRCENLRVAHQRGIFTWVSFEPVLDEEQVVSLFHMSMEDTDLYKIGKTNYGYPHTVKDWGAFGQRMVELCEQYGKAYYIKEDLRKELGLP